MATSRKIDMFKHFNIDLKQDEEVDKRTDRTSVEYRPIQRSAQTSVNK